MKSGKEILQDGGSVLPRKSSEPSQSETQITDWVWRKMAEMYGAQWTRERGTVPPTTWTKAIGKQAPESVRKAMARVATRHPDWPPSLPQFIACCTPQPEDFGAPSVEAAWHEARMHAMEPTAHAWSHDAVRLAGRRIGWPAIHGATGEYAKELKRSFRQEYAEACERMASGVELIESDAMKPASQQAIIESDEAGREAGKPYDGIDGASAVRLMKTMIKTENGNGENN